MPKGLFFLYGMISYQEEIRELSSYLNLLSTSMEAHKASFVSDIEAAASVIEDSDEKDSHYESHQDEYDSISISFPRFFYYSYAAYLYSYIEGRFKWGCKKVSSLGLTADPFVDNGKQGSVWRTKVFLEKAGISFIKETWDEFDDFNKIRNSIVHDAGILKGNGETEEAEETIKRIKEYADSRDGIILEDYHFSGDKRIIVSKDYCDYVTHLAGRLIGNMCSEITRLSK